MSPSGRLPFLVTERGKVYSGQADMMRYVSNKFTDINKSLTEAESAESDIFISLIENKLYPALLYNFWCESDNYHQSTKKLYGRNYPWPLNELITWNVRRKMSSLLEKRFNAVLADDIYNDASTALEALSTKLGDRQYFFNDSPTFVDALLFSHLHTILSVSLPTNKLRNLVLERENLVNYARKIWNLWFKDSGSASTMGRKASRSGTNTPFIGIK
ncbi:hypothetical protein BKA69DRAFT_895518 [Paraphysoderma sedebokerense]|nr:hypothetical protein BKA69DRAFT_895518 [Paraphysoderma sedebokerense]